MTAKISDLAILLVNSRERISINLIPKLAKFSVFMQKSIRVFSNLSVKMMEEMFLRSDTESYSRRRRLTLWIRVAMWV